jgi:hypothetical protein
MGKWRIASNSKLAADVAFFHSLQPQSIDQVRPACSRQITRCKPHKRTFDPDPPSGRRASVRYKAAMCGDRLLGNDQFEYLAQDLQPRACAVNRQRRFTQIRPSAVAAARPSKGVASHLPIVHLKEYSNADAPDLSRWRTLRYRHRICGDSGAGYREIPCQHPSPLGCFTTKASKARGPYVKKSNCWIRLGCGQLLPLASCYCLAAIEPLFPNRGR